MPDIFKRFQTVNQRPVSMDNVRNITGDPAGIDAEELFDTRELVRQVQDMMTKGKETQGLPTYPGNSTLRSLVDVTTPSTQRLMTHSFRL